MSRVPCGKIHPHELETENENENRRKTRKINVASVLFEHGWIRYIRFLFVYYYFSFVSKSKHQLTQLRMLRRLLLAVRSYVLESHLFIHFLWLCCAVRLLWHFWCASCLTQATKFEKNITVADKRRLRGEKKSTLQFNRCASIATHWFTTAIRSSKS